MSLSLSLSLSLSIYIYIYKGVSVGFPIGANVGPHQHGCGPGWHVLFAAVMRASVKKHSFSASLGPANQQQKPLFSP